MALQPSIRVINGRVFGAYAAQAKNVAYGQGTVEDALDALQINKITVTGTTDAYGRLNIGPLATINAAIIHAYSLDASYVFMPYRYNSSGGSIVHYVQIFRSDTTAHTVIANTSVTVTIYFIILQ